MFHNRIHLFLSALLLAVLVSAAAGGPQSIHVLASGDPCENVTGDPGPPVGPPEPEVSGTVIDSGLSSLIEDATITLYACLGTTAVEVDTQATDSSGQYVFTDVVTERWYYIEVEMSGPLSGLTPSAGTSNPSALVAIGDDPTVVNFSFE